ncbi:MAG: High potential iron-sulfur protein [Hydrocarboniphaga sp.]|uniref:high-potential iron-sulfur protein n=1 Tax=Hydrocarboniphaga sp. TaxID=2033016 RepID=UPI002610EA49|nr:high-potential iron-sulfur protein [Hydrocarboniphaga sp.]MDB5969085.1 High potential iron-sulfur protein [Hydrocarboniphaga sp.]
MQIPNSRRRFLGLCGAAALAAIPARSFAQAAAAKVDLNDPTAKALGYVENVASLKPGQEAALKTGSHCGNCALYTVAQEAAGHAPCGAFGGKLVAKTGWCRAYSPAAA